LTFGGASVVLAGPLQGREGAAADITIRVESGEPDPGPVASPPATAVELGGLDDRWVEAWEAVSGLDGTGETAQLVLSQLSDRARFALAVEALSGRPLGVCVGVSEEGWLGLFSLTVTPDARRRGIATSVVDALESWAATTGAEHTYLQVEASNSAALAFYAERGFHISHSYHYRSA
jgi:GNAT superfamily N-acetyltransferase